MTGIFKVFSFNTYEISISLPLQQSTNNPYILKSHPGFSQPLWTSTLLPSSLTLVALFKVRFLEFKLGPKGEKNTTKKLPQKFKHTQKKPHPLIKTYFWLHRFSFPHHLKVFFTVVTAEGFFVCQPDSAQQMGNPSKPHAGNHQLMSSCPAMERKISFNKEILMQLWPLLDTEVSSHKPKVLSVSNLDQKRNMSART